MSQGHKAPLACAAGLLGAAAVLVSCSSGESSDRRGDHRGEGSGEAPPSVTLEATRSGVRLGPFPREAKGAEAAPRDSAPPEQISTVLAVWTGAVDVSALTKSCRHPQGQATILGAYRWEPDDVLGEFLVFEPRFPFLNGQAFTACADLDLLARHLGRELAISTNARTLSETFEFGTETPALEAAPRVTHVAPKGLVPENLLRLYVHFSQPMQPRGVVGGVSLRRVGDEAPLTLPFVEIEQGLWDAERRRLTVFVHPGRIKRGVGPHLAMGSVLEAGNEYELQLGPPLRSATGAALPVSTRRLRAGAADRASPRIEAWVLRAPVGAERPLRVEFDEALDEALAARLLGVERASGEAIVGMGAVAPGARSWSFLPEEPWSPGHYRLVVSSAVEDLAGNSIARVFDVETSARAATPGQVVDSGQSERLSLPFSIPEASPSSVP